MSLSSSSLPALARLALRRQGLNAASFSRASWHLYSPQPQLQLQLHRQPAVQFSSISESGVRGWLEDRKARKDAQKFADQMKRMSEIDVFTMEGFKNELTQDLNKWTAKVAALQTQEAKVAKEIADTMEGVISVVGKDATVDRVLEMTRIERLKASVEANKTMEDIGTIIAQFRNMSDMHQILRKRKLEGKSIPKDEEQLKAVIQRDGLSALTSAQKAAHKKAQVQEMKRRMRSGR